MVTQKERVSASFVILQQMVSPCGLIAVLPPIFRMVTLFRMVAFIPAHRSEVYALTKKYARMETALLQTFVVHHITSTFPMEQLHGRARLAHKYIHITISRCQTHFPDLPTHTFNAHAHICRMLRHNYTVVLIQIEHKFFEDKGNQSRRNGKGGLFRMVTLRWLLSVSPPYYIYTNEKSLSHYCDQGSS